ncbi:MAG: hypothetical protein GX430_06220 [Treponema sp.]|nr:hypothetical protein [Treponema sp.]
MKRTFLAAAMLLASVCGFALELEYLNPRIGVILINNVITGGVGAPNALVNTLGASFSFQFRRNPRFSFDPGLDFYFTRYEWGADLRAHPTELETADAAFVLGAILDAPVLWRVNLSDRFDLLVGGGGALVLRAAFGSSGDVPSIGTWFYRGLRWFYPDAQVRLAYRLQEKFTFEFIVRGFLPLFNALDPDAPSFFDHAMLNAGMGMRIKLR